MKKSRKESELTTVDSQIRGLESRLKYALTDRDTTVRIYCILNTFYALNYIYFYSTSSRT